MTVSSVVEREANKIQAEVARLQTIALTAISQLTGIQQGGMGRLHLMTGAKRFYVLSEEKTASEDGTDTIRSIGGIQFDLPKKRNFVKDGIDRVRILLSVNDDYVVQFWKIGNGLNPKLVNQVDGIYGDMLKENFEDTTGLRVSL